MKKLTTASILAAGLFAGSAHAGVVTYEYSFTAADLMNYVVVDGADGSTPVDNSLYDGARLVRNVPGNLRSYVASENDDFETWATTTEHQMTALNLWGFDGKGAGWGEDFKHTDSQTGAGASGWAEWPGVGWVASWGPNPNPNTDQSVGWLPTDSDARFGFGDADLAAKEFTFQMSFDEDDWLYGANTGGAPNTLGGETTFWFGGWMGDEANPYRYIYEGNMVLTGSAVPEPGMLALMGLGLGSLGFFRRRRLGKH